VNEKKLIVFLKAPRPGEVKTRLAETLGAEAACAAYRRLLTTLLENLAALERVELCFSPSEAGREVQPWARPGWSLAEQGAGDLGERLQRAFQRAFHAGAGRVVILGSDCPEVAAADIDDAWAALSAHDVVLGPATDGGYWLIGLRAARPELFQGISWSTSEVLRQTLDRIREAGLRAHLLRELSDIDAEADWRRFLARAGED
jgi:hypothetical protein